MCGPGDVTYDLPPGTDTFQLELTPSGHLGLLCGQYPDKRQLNQDAKAINLLSSSVHTASAAAIDEPMEAQAAVSRKRPPVEAEPTYTTQAPMEY